MLNSVKVILICFVFSMFFKCEQQTPKKSSERSYSGTDQNDTTKATIIWDKNSLVKIADAEAYYARIIKLHDDSLLCVYQADHDIAVTKSGDKGKTWSAPIKVAIMEDNISMETPDILELNDNSILVSYNPRPLKPYDKNRKFSIHTKKSYDGGHTWTDKRIVYEAGYQFENGCWEPALLQLPNGEVQLYFSNEVVYKTREQNISLMCSEDEGLTWSSDPKVISYRAQSRDGMPVPIFLKKSNEVVVAIEDNSGENFKPYTVRTTTGMDWTNNPVDGDSPRRSYALASRLDSHVYAGAPYLIKLNKEHTLLSYQSTENRKNNTMEVAEMKVAIGDKKAQNFRKTNIPFDIPKDKNALWNSLYAVNDTTVLALTTTNAYSTNNDHEIWLIKGHVRN